MRTTEKKEKYVSNLIQEGTREEKEQCQMNEEQQGSNFG